MEKRVEEIHNLLDDIYTHSENLYQQIKKQYDNVVIDSYKGHLIKINSQYQYQKYYMPVISVADLGDICFNLDGISLEFFVDKNDFINISDLNSLLNLDIEIYDAKDSTIDLYENDMSVAALRNNLKQTKQVLIGITINCQDKTDEEVINTFNTVCKYLYSNKNNK